MKTELNRLLAVVTILALTSFGCGGAGSRTQRTTIENLRAQFPEVAAQELSPLEEVTVPERDMAPEPAAAQRLVTGQAAGFDGLLLSDSAAAYVVSEYAAIQSRYGAALLQQRQRDFARLVRETEVLRLRMNGDRERFFISFQGQDAYIQELESVAFQDNTIMDVLVIIGAGAVGVVIGIIVGFFLAN